MFTAIENTSRFRHEVGDGRAKVIREVCDAWEVALTGDLIMQNEAARAYFARSHNVFSADDAKRLIPYYDQDPQYRSKYNAAVRNLAGKITKIAFNRRILDSSNSRQVVYLAGGPGSGKTHSQKMVLERYDVPPHALYDTTMSRFEESKGEFLRALSSGKKIDVYFVARDFKQAARSIIRRACVEGRVTPLSHFTNSHFQTPRNILRLLEEFSSHSQVQFHAVDNSGQLGEAKVLHDDTRSLLKSKILDSREECEIVARREALDELEIIAKNHPRRVIDNIRFGFFSGNV